MLDPLICGLGGFALEPNTSRTLGKTTKGFLLFGLSVSFRDTAGWFVPIGWFGHSGMRSRHDADIVKYTRLALSRRPTSRL
jgi:hypothetical protein